VGNSKARQNGKKTLGKCNKSKRRNRKSTVELVDSENPYGKTDVLDEIKYGLDMKRKCAPGKRCIMKLERKISSHVSFGRRKRRGGLRKR
jgi:hypothetical protein